MHQFCLVQWDGAVMVIPWGVSKLRPFQMSYKYMAAWQAVPMCRRIHRGAFDSFVNELLTKFINGEETVLRLPNASGHMNTNVTAKCCKYSVFLFLTASISWMYSCTLEIIREGDVMSAVQNMECSHYCNCPTVWYATRVITDFYNQYVFSNIFVAYQHTCTIFLYLCHHISMLNSLKSAIKWQTDQSLFLLIFMFPSYLCSTLIRF